VWVRVVDLVLLKMPLKREIGIELRVPGNKNVRRILKNGIRGRKIWTGWFIAGLTKDLPAWDTGDILPKQEVI